MPITIRFDSISKVLKYLLTTKIDENINDKQNSNCFPEMNKTPPA